MDENRYVADSTLNYYDPKIKAWFELEINAVPEMEVKYDEENRILEFVETINSST